MDSMAEPLFKLGISAGFAINRFPEPEVWLQIVGERLGLRYCQFVADLLSPFLPDDIITREVARIREEAERYGVCIETTFTSIYTRVNHLLHPNPAIRRVWFDWFRRWFKISADLGAKGSGSHFGILSVRDYSDPERRQALIREGIRSWQELTKVARDYGLQFLIYEPMSVPRELGETISKAKELYDAVNENAAIPFLFCLDVDHGDAMSGDPRDSDPYSWLRELGSMAPVVHIKQSIGISSGHLPFTEEYNRIGKIRPDKVLEALRESGAKEVTLLLEIAHRERRPIEDRVLEDIEESVRYWRKWVKD